MSAGQAASGEDMHQKCQYINEISGGKGVIYLTGTPVSNSMAELYVLQKTLQPQELERRDLLMFDEWAGTYGKVVSSLEIKPEGNGYQMKNRFAQFHNLPELMSMFAMIADIKTADMLDLPTPKLKTGRGTGSQDRLYPGAETDRHGTGGTGGEYPKRKRGQQRGQFLKADPRGPPALH